MAIDAILRLPEVIRRAGPGRSSIYRGVAAGTFPAPVAIGLRSIGWRESDIEAWIESRAPKPGCYGAKAALPATKGGSCSRRTRKDEDDATTGWTRKDEADEADPARAAGGGS